MSRNKPKVFVGMSGGVDSSVAAHLLKKQGYDVTGVFMRSYNIDGCAEQDAEDARRVAGKLGIPFYVWDFEEEYKKKVVEYMVEGYRKGETPNPDVMCNREIKFGIFLKRALDMGADYVSTGHYVRLGLAQHFPHAVQAIGSKIPASQDSLRSARSAGQGAGYRILSLSTSVFSLIEAKDKNKDQSYFLWILTQNELKHCLFPIGDYLKSEVREIARKAGLSTAEKKDSQGICFLGQVSLADFLKNYIPEKRGNVMNITGEKLGEHTGAYFYTIGQRHLDLAKRETTRTVHAVAKALAGERRLTRKDQLPIYVTGKNVKTNTLTVAEGNDHPALYKKEILLRDVNFITSHYSNILQNIGIVGMQVWARVRYRQPLARATLTYAGSPAQVSFGNLGGQAWTNMDKVKIRRGSALSRYQVRVVFDEAQKFVAPGQSAVFYNKKGEMLGGGVIGA